jgi:hypothetical protein
MEIDNACERILAIRRNAESMGETLSGIPDAPWHPLADQDFWFTLDDIEHICDTKDGSRVGYLVDLIIIRDLEPMGRGMILSHAALVAIEQVQQAAQREILKRLGEFGKLETRFQKIGCCLLIAASGISREYDAVINLLSQFTTDDDAEVKKLASRILLKAGV